MDKLFMIGRAEEEGADGMVHRKQATDFRGFVPDTLDEETRSVEVVAASEAPNRVYDPARWEVINEVLLMSGVQIPRSGQIPLTIEHYRDAGSAIGSLRDIRVSGKRLLGRVYFSTADDAEPFWIKVKEGHLDRFSISYPADNRDSVYIAEGEESTVDGKTYKGPILITKKWTPKALGLVLFSADENTKARTESNNSSLEDIEMTKRLREFLERSGLKKEATEDEAWAFMDRHELKLPVAPSGDPAPKPTPAIVPAAIAPVASAKDAEIDIDKERKEAGEAERTRIVELTAMCQRHEVEDDVLKKMIDEGVSVDVGRQQTMVLIEARKDNSSEPGFHPATILADDRDKFRSAAEDALMIRSGVVEVKEPAPGASDLTGYSMTELARHSLRVASQPEGGRPLEMIGRAMTTSDFPLLLAAVANKSLFAGWEKADETWPVWCGTGQVNDFKTHKSVRVSEASDLDEVPEDTEYSYGKRTEAQETYAIATFGKMFAISRQTIINDDLNALSNQPMSHGESAARKVGDVSYAVLSANAAMGDDIALFHGDHSNFVDHASGAVPGIATIAAGILAMGTQKDLQGLRRLNIRPEFFIAPKALEGLSEVFFKTDKFADSDTIATDSSFAATRVNPYSGKYFTRVYEPRLDDDDAAAWYLAARKGRTVVVYFLDGVQAPYMETKMGWSVDGVEYKVRIDVGAKAMDWKGLYYNDGN